MPSPVRSSPSSLVDKIRTLLAARGLTLAAIARKSRDDSSGGRLHHIPHNLYDAIRKRQFSPSLHQIATLSILTGYRLTDWLELFEFSLDDVPRLQATFPTLRTVELDANVYHPRTRIPWFRDVGSPSFAAPLIPLSRWLTPAEPVRAEALAPSNATAFRFVKIGLQDDYAFPDLLPGSIVRVEPMANGPREIPDGSTLRKKLFLVEHGDGLACSLLGRSQSNRLVLCSRHLPYASVELEESTQARVLGLADVEVRRIVHIEKPTVPRNLGAYWTPGPLRQGSPARNVGEFIQQARKRSGLSFREASKRTRVIAQKLRDPRYFCAPGSLSDCEARKSPPRHIHKAISICVVYFAKAADFLEAAGVQLSALGQMPIPPRFLEQPQRGKNIPAAPISSKCMKEIERRFEQLPIFLHGTMPEFFGLPDLSVRDVFWAGGVQQFVHPYLDRAAFLVVDRRKKIPRSSLSCPKWAQPLYVFLRRDGSYLCGSGTRSNETLIIHPCTAGLPKLLKLRNRKDAEVIGQIVGIVRRLK